MKQIINLTELMLYCCLQCDALKSYCVTCRFGIFLCYCTWMTKKKWCGLVDQQHHCPWRSKIAVFDNWIWYKRPKGLQRLSEIFFLGPVTQKSIKNIFSSFGLLMSTFGEMFFQTKVTLFVGQIWDISCSQLLLVGGYKSPEADEINSPAHCAPLNCKWQPVINQIN